MKPIIPYLVAFGPVLLLSILFIPRDWANANPRVMTKLTGGLTWIALGAAILATLGFLNHGRITLNFFTIGSTEGFHFAIGVFFDALSAIMLLLVSFMGAVVTRYAENYLDGDAKQGQFMKWLAVTIGSVLTLIVSGNLVMFVLAWVATSTSLHKLLLFYPERPAAQLAARKKFIISRAGDLCLVGAMTLIYTSFNNLDFGQIFAAADALRAAGSEDVGAFTWIALLLALGALLKSAQFPFHSWLPEVMETPTPVSALLHAGIINAGGFLIVRMSPVFSLSPIALDFLAVVGAFTALFASVVMLTQTSIKTSLAYSTVAQMGFMMLQCGLGAYAAAVLHIIAHSMYKAHAFLSSGSIIDIARSSWVPTRREKPHMFQLIAALFMALGLTLAMAWAFGITPDKEPGVVVLGSVLMMAVTHLIWNSFGDEYTLPVAVRGVVMAVGVCFVFFTLQSIFAFMLAGALPELHPLRTSFDIWLMGGVIILFMAVLVFQTQLPYRADNPTWQKMYVYAFNGLYINTFANKLVQRFWPIDTQQTA